VTERGADDAAGLKNKNPMIASPGIVRPGAEEGASEPDLGSPSPLSPCRRRREGADENGTLGIRTLSKRHDHMDRPS